MTILELFPYVLSVRICMSKIIISQCCSQKTYKKVHYMVTECCLSFLQAKLRTDHFGTIYLMCRQLGCVECGRFSILFANNLHKGSLHGNWMLPKLFTNKIKNWPFWNHLPDFTRTGVWNFFDKCQFVGKRQKMKGRASKVSCSSWINEVASVLTYR